MTSFSLRLHETFRDALDGIVPALADYAFVHMVREEGKAREVAVAHRDPDLEVQLIQVLHRMRDRITGPDHRVGRALAEGEIQRVEGPAARRMIQGLTGNRKLLAALRPFEPHSFVALPLTVQGEIFGVLSLARTDTKVRYTDREVQFLDAIAHQAALAIANASLLEEHVADVEDALEPPAEAATAAQVGRRLKLRDRATLVRAVSYVTGGIADAVDRHLGTIRDEAGLLLLDPSLKDITRTGLRRIIDGTDEAGRPLSYLKEFGPQDDGLPLEVDVDDVVTRSVRWVARRAGERVSIDLDARAERPAVRGDEEAVGQAVVELLLNAVEATLEREDAGEVSVWTSNEEITEEEAEQYAYRVEPGHYVCISVRDTGPGMDEETAGHALEPFFTTREGPEHAGLGVTLAYGVAKLMGGYLWLETEEGEGTTARLYMPELGTREPEEDRPESFAGPVVLVFDDTDALNDAVEILKDRDYQVFRVENRAEAIRVWRSSEGSIDLVLLDADISARSLIEQLRLIRSDLPVIYTSRALGVESALQRVSGPRTLFLRRPLTAERLMPAVEKLLREPAPD